MRKAGIAPQVAANAPTQQLADLPVQSTKRVFQPLGELPTQAAKKVIQPLAELPAQAANTVLKVFQPLWQPLPAGGEIGHQRSDE